MLALCCASVLVHNQPLLYLEILDKLLFPDAEELITRGSYGVAADTMRNFCGQRKQQLLSKLFCRRILNAVVKDISNVIDYD